MKPSLVCDMARRAPLPLCGARTRFARQSVQPLSRRFGVGAIVVVAALALAACGRVEESTVVVGAPLPTTTTTSRPPATTQPRASTPTQVPTSTVAAVSLPEAPTGYRWETSKAGDISLLVPRSWSSIDLTKDDIEAMIKQVEKTNPELGSQMRANKAAFRQIDMFVIGPTKNGFGPNVNLVEVPSGLPVESIMEAAKDQFAAFATIIDTSKRTVAGQDAAMLRYSLESNGITIAGVQIYVPFDDFVAAFTISGDVPADVFDIMVNSITLA
jgi:hypothetical protein